MLLFDTVPMNMGLFPENGAGQTSVQSCEAHANFHSIPRQEHGSLARSSLKSAGKPISSAVHLS